VPSRSTGCCLVQRRAVPWSKLLSRPLRLPTMPGSRRLTLPYAAMRERSIEVGTLAVTAAEATERGTWSPESLHFARENATAS